MSKFIKVKELFFTIAFSLLLVAGFNQIFAIISVEGISMDSTLQDNSMHISLRREFVGEIEKGDVVFFEARIGEKRVHLIKRVIATAGDNIKIENNLVYLNGVLLEEYYINGPMTNSQDMELQIEEGEYFLMGDNRDHSVDSRDIGPVPESAIRGKLVL